MFKAARLARIKELVMDRTQIDVQTLSSLLNVSSVTIRSDLEELEHTGFLYRTRGGAVLCDSSCKASNADPAAATIEYSKDKEQIAGIAARMVDENSWFFLGPGTTCYYIAKAVAKQHGLNIITNNLYVASALSSNPTINLVFTGGKMNPSNMSLSGELFEDAFKNIYVKQAFVSVAGIDLQKGIFVSNLEEGNALSVLRSACSEMIIVADHSKFGRVSFKRIGALNFADAIITNDSVPESYKEYCFNSGIRMYTSYEINPSSVLTPEKGVRNK